MNQDLNTFRLSRSQYVLPVLAVLLLLVGGYIVSLKKLYWYDELLTYYLVTDPSLSHMLQAMANNVDTAPPFYHLIGRIWILPFSDPGLALRILGALFVCAALLITWICLRRAYSPKIASLATLFVFLTSYIVLDKTSEVRFYGLYLALTAAAVFQYLTLIQNEKPHWKQLLATSLIIGAYVLTHYIAIIFSGLFGLGLLIYDLGYKRRFRPIVYLSILLGLCLFIPWLPVFRLHSQFAAAYGWATKPDFRGLVGIYLLGFSMFLPLLLVVLYVINRLVLRPRLRKLGLSVRNTISPERQDTIQGLRLIGWLLAAGPLVIWTLSQFVTASFIPRYMMPALIGAAIVLADELFEFASSLNTLFKRDSDSQYAKYQRRKDFLVRLAFGLMFVGPVIYVAQYPAPPALPGTQELAYGYTDLPVAASDAFEFLTRYYYLGDSRRHYFLLDLESALDERSSRFAPVQNQIMDSLRTSYPQFQAYIVPLDEFLNRYDRFLVIESDINRWPEIRFENNSEYRWTVLGQLPSGTLVLVEAVHP